MTRLIEDLLKYSRLSNPLRMFDLDLNQIARNVHADFEHLLKEKNISFQSQGLPVVNAIEIQMQQLFSNLISNAIKFSKPGRLNKISISASEISAAEIRSFPGLSEGKYYKIVFQDEGIGFEPKFNEQIFTIFQRLNNRTDYEGHGIGLALCRKIINTHKGLILADGREGEGATFTVLLPAV